MDIGRPLIETPDLLTLQLLAVRPVGAEAAIFVALTTSLIITRYYEDVTGVISSAWWIVLVDGERPGLP
jgi:hypothetical protein